MTESTKHAHKANRHLHITGALSPAELKSVSEKASVPLDGYGDLEKHLNFTDPTIWAASKELTSDKTGLLYAIVTILDKERLDSVTHIELTVNVFGMIRRGLNAGEIALVLDTAKDYGRKIGVDLKIKFGVNRKDGAESIDPVREVYEATSPDVRWGVDLNGDEDRYPTKEFVSGFLELSEDGVPTSIHAGEFPDQTQSLRDAITARPQRIGHAVVAGLDRYSFDAIKADGTTVEVGLSSNLILGAVPSIGEHPVRSFIEHEIPLVFGSDDPGFFGTTMSDEFKLLDGTGLGAEQIHEVINRNTNIDI